MHLTALSLFNFRNYTQVDLTDLPAGLVYLVGANGAGKTNILEAISLLPAGRGLRGADMADIQNRGSDGDTAPWAGDAHLPGEYGPPGFCPGGGPPAPRPRWPPSGSGGAPCGTATRPHRRVAQASGVGPVRWPPWRC